MSERTRYTKAENEWIIANINMSVPDEYEAFIKVFGEAHTFSSFKTRRARLNYQGNSHAKYTLEEDEWIKVNYPTLGAVKAFKEFCERFGEYHTMRSFRTRVNDLGVNIPKEKQVSLRRENHKYENVPIGTIVKRGRGHNWIKVGEGAEGWIPLVQYLLDIPEGMIAIHLDGDKANDDPDNLRIISKQVAVRMSRNKFWSKDPIITETGIRCCELQEALRKNDVAF